MNRKCWKIAVMAVMAVLSAFLLSVEVLAQEGDEIRLDETGTVTLTSQEAARAGVSSLQIGLRVDSAEGEKVEFIFAESNTKILEFRYDGEARQWNLYLAGTEALFAKDSNTLTLGRVVVLNRNGEAATATVSVPKNSAWYVYGTELRSIEALKLPQPVVINAKEVDSPGEENDQEDDASQGPDEGNGTTPGSADDPGAAGDENEGTGSGTGAAGDGNEGMGNGTGAAGDGNQAATGSGTGTAGSGSQGTGSSSGAAGSGSQGTGNSSGAAGSGNQAATGSGTGAAGSGSGTGTAGNGSQGTGSSSGAAGSGNQAATGNGSQVATGSGTGTAGNGSQGTGSGSQGSQSISHTVSPSSGVQPANAETAGKDSEKKAAGIDWEIVLIILAALFAAVFGVLAAMMTVKIVTRRR